MHVAILTRPADPLSLRLYEANMIHELSALGVEITPFQENDSLPSNCDILWDPSMCMRRIPTILQTKAVPVIGTMHGVKAFSLPMEELTKSPDERYALEQIKKGVYEDWQWFRANARAITAVSKYAAKEIIDAFSLTASMVHVVRNGIDQAIFCPNGDSFKTDRPYFLHVSRIDPIKNLERIFAAYELLPKDDRPGMIAVVTPEEDQKELLVHFEQMVEINGVHWIRKEVSQHDLARLYRGAMALVLPSLRETFGMPIIEAMASGCPVITSSDTGCAETAGNAAILVDPRSVDDIASAMRCLKDEPELSKTLQKKGLARANRFTWGKSAEEIVKVFLSVVSAKRKSTAIIRKIEITTKADCQVNCQFCPQAIFQEAYSKTNGAKVLNWETFTICLNKLPATVNISFGGMSEPFQNPLCTQMIEYAKGHGHTVEVFTTLVGITPERLNRVLAVLRLGREQAYDRLFIHLATADTKQRIIVDDEYIEMINHLLSSGVDVEYHHHGIQIHPRLRELPFGNALKYWPLHNRANNETPFYKRGHRKSGKIACIMNLEVPILLPNGDLLICSQDFGMNCVVGNILNDSIEDILRGSSIKAIQAALVDDKQDIMCRYCHFAVDRYTESISKRSV